MRAEQNELITKTGPNSPLGRVFRSYWIPALLSEEIPEPDCTPARVNVLGERLVAFRDSQGRVGLLDARCPHRLADLFFGRNEESGLRCVYHGWKFDVDGRCLDMPTEDSEGSRKDRVCATAYPVLEHGGIIWTCLAKKADAKVPNLPFLRVPPEQRYVSKCLMRCNYLQAVEGSIDTAHLSFLHRTLESGENAPDVFGVGHMLKYSDDDGRPKFFVNRAPYGLRILARREATAESRYWRISHWLMPFYVFVPTAPGLVSRANLFVPIDDQNCWWYRIRWHADRALTQAERSEFRSGGLDYAQLIPGTYLPAGNQANDYLLDRHEQRTISFTGIKSAQLQDIAIQESQGGIVDRSMEHLGSTDMAIVECRRALLDALKESASGLTPFTAANPDCYNVDATAITAPRDVEAAGLSAFLEQSDAVLTR